MNDEARETSGRTTGAISAPSQASNSSDVGAAGSVLLFDGVCNLCNRSVQFVLRHERSRELRFAALQSHAGAALLLRHRLPPAFLESLVLIDDGRAFTRSDAALAIARHLRPPWSWLRAFRWLPRFVRDACYDFIAKRRYRWFGKREEACLLPSLELRQRFLD